MKLEALPKLKTTGMKISDIRPCSFCGGKIVPQFYIIDVKPALFTPDADKMMGQINMMGGMKSIFIAEAMSPFADTAIQIIDNPEIAHRLFICQKCFLTGAPIDIVLACETENDRKLEEARRKAKPTPEPEPEVIPPQPTQFCGRLAEGGYATENLAPELKAGLEVIACLKPATARVPERGGDIYLCEEHAAEYARHFPDDTSRIVVIESLKTVKKAEGEAK